MKKPILCVDTHELAWAAGFFDGEGSVMWRGRKRKELSLSIAQSERAPLERFHAAVGYLGSLRGPYRHKADHHRSYWVLSTHGLEQTQAVVAMLWRWLCDPKRAQAEQSLRDAIPYYRQRHEHGKGRAALTLVQVTELRAAHAAAGAGRKRVPRGWIAAAAQKYGVKPGTIASICQGYGYDRA